MRCIRAYFNAALFLLGIDAPLDEGNPYAASRYSREPLSQHLAAPIC